MTCAFCGRLHLCPLCDLQQKPDANGLCPLDGNLLCDMAGSMLVVRCARTGAVRRYARNMNCHLSQDVDGLLAKRLPVYVGRASFDAGSGRWVLKLETDVVRWGVSLDGSLVSLADARVLMPGVESRLEWTAQNLSLRLVVTDGSHRT